jgi:outer membrane protein OmpA-like peptidoglycan-associated protein
MNSRNIIRSTWLGIIFLIVAMAVPGLAQDDPLRHGYALLVADWDYDDSRWPPLGDVRLQARELKAGLDRHFDAVDIVPNPTFDELDFRLRQFLRMRGNDDRARLLVYYAGHGYTETVFDRNEYRGYITGRDTPYVDGSSRSYSAARVKALSMEAVRSMVSDISARQVLFIFDSCFAGTVFSARSPTASIALSMAEINRLADLPVREFITAGDANQTVPAHSPLPDLLLSALSGAADKYHLGIVTGQNIAEYLWTETRRMGANITPRSGKLPGGYFDRGEFVFRVGISRPLIEPTLPAPQSPISRAYLVFFDWKEAVLTDRARQIISEVAASSLLLTASGVQDTQIEVNGYDDTSSSAQDSQILSVKRAQAIAAELVKDGVPKTAIRIAGFGGTHLLVPTGAGVREPQNRRAEILIR